MKRTGIANCRIFKNNKIQDWDTGSLLEPLILLIVLTDQLAVYVLIQLIYAWLLFICSPVFQFNAFIVWILATEPFSSGVNIFTHVVKMMAELIPPLAECSETFSNCTSPNQKVEWLVSAFLHHSSWERTAWTSQQFLPQAVMPKIKTKAFS